MVRDWESVLHVLTHCRCLWSLHQLHYKFKIEFAGAFPLSFCCFRDFTHCLPTDTRYMGARLSLGNNALCTRNERFWCWRPARLALKGMLLVMETNSFSANDECVWHRRWTRLVISCDVTLFTPDNLHVGWVPRCRSRLPNIGKLPGPPSIATPYPAHVYCTWKH